MDYQTPPPSYEAATGIGRGAQNPFFRNISPVPPPQSQNDDQMSTQFTIPILPNRDTQRTNTIMRHQPLKIDKKICVCFFVTLTVMIGLMICLVIVARSAGTGKFRTNHSISKIETNIGDRELESNFLEKTYPDLEQRIRESKWNFKTIQEND